MTHHRAAARPLERSAWVALIACVAVVPLAVAKLPFLDAPLVPTAFAFPQTVSFLVGVAIALGIWGAAHFRNETPLVLAPWMAAVAAFVAWAGIATGAAYEPLRSLLGKSTSSLSFTAIVAYAALFFLAMQLARSRERMRTLTWTVILSATVVAAIALIQQLFNTDFFGIPALEAWFISRGFSTLGNPDHLGTFLVLPVVLSATVSLFEADARLRMATLGCFAVLAAAVTGSLSRGAWLGALSGGLVLVILVWRNRRDRVVARHLVALLGVLAVAIAVSLAGSDSSDLVTRFPSPAQPGAESGPVQTVNAISSDRINVWRSSLLIAADRPLTGTGPAAFELGWYPAAIDPSSGGGGGGIADDPHSIVAYLLTTLGIPGLLTWLTAVIAGLVLGARTSVRLIGEADLTGTPLYYVSWFAATAALYVSLLLAAVSTPIVMYGFLGVAVLLQPSGKTKRMRSGLAARLLPAIAACTLTLLLVISVWPNLAAEVKLASQLASGALDSAREAADSARWNTDVQKAYYHARVTRVDTLLTMGSPSSAAEVANLLADLEGAGARQPREYYYPSVRAQVLTRASEVLGPDEYAEAAVRAADDALAIMPASIPTRVHRALALSDLSRYTDMANTLHGYWENELGSAYPGILYAQALALSGRPDEATSVFATLKARFPDDASIESARLQTEQLLKQR